MPSTRRGRSWPAKPAIIPACVEPVTEQTMTVSKKTPSSALLLGDLAGPAREAEPAERMVGGAGRDRVRLAAARLDSASASSQLVRKPMSKPAGDEPHVGAHDPREQDVADPVVDGVGPVDPVLLDEHAAEPEVRGDRGDLAGVVRLDAADRDERVAALGERVGGEVLELAHLVAAEREPGVAVLALGPDLDRAAEVLGQPLEPVDRRRPEQQRTRGKSSRLTSRGFRLEQETDARG